MDWYRAKLNSMDNFSVMIPPPSNLKNKTNVIEVYPAVSEMETPRLTDEYTV